MERSGFIIEELSDFSDAKEGHSRNNTVQPDEIEYAESDQSGPKRPPGADNTEDKAPQGLGLSIVDSSDSDGKLSAISARIRALDRRKRMGTSSMSKRKMNERSDSDNEDHRHSNPGGPSARRLTRRAGMRRNLAFHDPSPRLNEMDAPHIDHLEDDLLAREQLYFSYNTMRMDSPWTPTLNASDLTSDSFQDAEGNQNVPELKQSIHVNPSIGAESGLNQSIGESARVSDDEEGIRDGFGSCADETGSVRSYTDSIFDHDSVGSSVSSVYSDTQALVGEYVDFLVRDPGLEKLFTRAMLPTVLGPERFRRNYSRILQSYARDLKRQESIWSEPKMPLRTQGLAFISRRSITMKTASIIASRYMEKAPRAQFRPGSTENENAEVPGGDETSSGDDSPVNESNHTFVISELGQYFREGAPFQRMKRNLRNLVIPSTLLSHVKASTERILDLVLGDEYLRFLLFKALSDPLAPLRDDQLDPERGINYFGSRLKTEANSPDQLRVADFIETYAGYIGTRAAQRMKGMDMEAILQGSQVCAASSGHSRCLVIYPGLLEMPTDR